MYIDLFLLQVLLIIYTFTWTEYALIFVDLYIQRYSHPLLTCKGVEKQQLPHQIQNLKHSLIKWNLLPLFYSMSDYPSQPTLKLLIRQVLQLCQTHQITAGLYRRDPGFFPPPAVTHESRFSSKMRW